MKEERNKTLHFEVNGQTYFLSFVPDEGEWYLLTPTKNGIEDVEIQSDDPPLTGSVMLPIDEEDKKTIN